MCSPKMALQEITLPGRNDCYAGLNVLLWTNETIWTDDGKLHRRSNGYDRGMDN